jgi:hypothetical protein
VGYHKEDKMKLTKQRIKEIIKEELEDMNEEPMEEGLENITAENVGLVIDSIAKMSPMLSGAGALLIMNALYEKYVMKDFKNVGSKEEERGDK